MEPTMNSNSSLKVIDVLGALLERERVEEAVDIQLDAVCLAVEHDLEILDVLELSVDEFVKLYEPPKRVTLPAVPGWDRVIYGEAAFKERE